ncbi:hypothetical protein CAAN1_02S00364 [[Candida] anglica]|uniref:Very-long-chain (3R)-3-hydroxyacyl-CoA dehydratase n=1 Tax=[Candida] anglica TaxID=148631 RepID=A0ABP0E6N4_9ASCO
MAQLYPLSTKGKLIFFYNVTSFTLWLCCLGRLLILLPLVGRSFVPGGIADFFHVVSLLPIISLLIIPTWSRERLWSVLNCLRMAWICYGVIFPYPRIAKHTSYSFLIISWCITNIINSGYYSFRVKTRTSPQWLFWLKHHIFFITFPMSLVSEMILIFLSLGFVDDDSIYELILKGAFLLYIPVAYFYWGHLKSTRVIKYKQVIAKRVQGRTASTNI